MPASPITALLDVAFPPRCVACGAGTAERGRRDWCPGCEADLGVFCEPVCQRCATPLADPDADASGCPVCRDERWAFERVVALGPYDGLLRRLVLEGKRRAGQPAMEGLGRLLGESGIGPIGPIGAPDAVVVPVPQHWTRRLARRADGVGAMAATLAGELRLPRLSVLRRTRATRRQTEIAPSDRAANVRGSLALWRKARVAGKTVLLIDDVFTTGATCQTAARALKQAGAARVVAVVAARRLGSL